MINKNNLFFIIYTPVYNENIGGIIVLHKLCAILNKMGISAKLWHNNNPVKICSFSTLKNRIRYKIKSFFNHQKYKSPYKLDVASPKELKNAIVIYPEITDGNPLEAKKVVRWLLYTPGAFTGKINYGNNELFFYYNHQFVNKNFKFKVSGQLTVTENMRDIYKQVNFAPRKGTCYMVRKGNKRNLNYHPKDALQVDGYSHRELADIFNKYEYFISYDLHTMYSNYAAMCGCKSIVVPESGKSPQEILNEQNYRPGVAYGREDISRALATRHLLFENDEQREIKEQKYVKEFIEICYTRFYNKK
ncbi:hypothetical protein NB647_07485 [Oxalobacter aliiformigenes]|uniref:hypothetical protein n=1 Tax=Oxalobacter aliiformigenes TaxID=2946593 RepID=UPI0022AF6834|nr:hypothetical protein [Oxalobacter aliiformigenes]WAV88722.1 hypothetical protein NB647_07485 [Oxalobacter aliiformigenes]